MRARLAAALKNQPKDGESKDIAALRGAIAKRQLNKLTSTVKQTQNVSAVLEEPKLPGPQDVPRWWPEPRPSRPRNPLVPFGTHTLSYSPRGRDERSFDQLQSTAFPDVQLPVAMRSARSPATHDGLRIIVPRYDPSPPHEVHGIHGMHGMPATQPPSPPGSPPRAGRDSPPSLGFSRPGSPIPRPPGSPPSRAGTSQSARSPRRRQPTRDEPSRNFGDPRTVALLDGGDSAIGDAFELIDSVSRSHQASIHLEALDRTTRLAHWMNAFAADNEAFASKAVRLP